jgi:hypothetical protein
VANVAPGVITLSSTDDTDVRPGHWWLLISRHPRQQGVYRPARGDQRGEPPVRGEHDPMLWQPTAQRPQHRHGNQQIPEVQRPQHHRRTIHVSARTQQVPG